MRKTLTNIALSPIEVRLITEQNDVVAVLEAGSSILASEGTTIVIDTKHMKDIRIDTLQ